MFHLDQPKGPSVSTLSALTAREKALLAIVRDVCAQELGERFQLHTEQALRAGMCRSDIKEAILHLTIYASFPKVLCALLALRAPESHELSSSVATPKPAINLFAQPGVREALVAIDPDFADLAMRMGGEIWGRGGMTQKERAFMCLASHLCNGTLDPIPVHSEIAMRAGATERALREVMAIACAFAPTSLGRAAIDSLEAFFATRANKLAVAV